jgi:hypothetical protein
MRFALFFALLLFACGGSSSPTDASASDATGMDATASDASDAMMLSDAIAEAAMDAPIDAGSFACGPSLMCARYEEYCFDLDGTNYQCRPVPAQCKPAPSCTCPNENGTGMCTCMANGVEVHWTCHA